MISKHIINSIVEDLDRHHAAMTAIYDTYRKDRAVAKQRASAYKDEDGAFNKINAALIADARQRINAADTQLADAVKAALPKLKKELSGYLTAPANPALIQQLQTYLDFDLKMSKGELEAFIVKAEGNFSALKAIQRVAANSGFAVSVPDGFEKDLESIAKLAQIPSMWCDSAYLSEAMEVLPNMPHFADDGTVIYTADRPDSVSLLIRSAGSKAVLRDLVDMADRWGTAFIPAISELKPVKDLDTGEVVSTPEQLHSEAVAAAADMVDIRAVVKTLQADPDCQAVLDHYI